MEQARPARDHQATVRNLPRNVWAASVASFFMDISSEMVMNLLPLFLANVLGVKTAIIGVIEGVAQATASLMTVLSGRYSDRQRARKWLAVAGYAISALSKPLFALATNWGVIAAARWADRVGKGVRTAPRDALVADSISEQTRGVAFGFERAADTAGAMCGVVIALAVVWHAQAHASTLDGRTFRTIALLSVLPAFFAVMALAVGAHDVPMPRQRTTPTSPFRSLGRPFLVFMVIVSIFDLGNSSDAFLVLRAQERGLSVTGILSMLAVFNLVYALVSTPAGQLSDTIGRRQLLIGGWVLYAAIYLGFGFAQTTGQIWAVYVLYGVYYGLAYGAAKAMIADLVPETLRGTAYGAYNAVLGVLDFPASVIAGVLWQGVGSWQGFGAPAPFLFGGAMALLAAVLLATWLPHPSRAEHDQESKKGSSRSMVPFESGDGESDRVGRGRRHSDKNE